MSLQAANNARLQKALNKKYNFSGTISTLGNYILSQEWTHKTATIQEYANKKRNGCYAKLKTPKTNFTIWREDGGGILVPKIVWDTLNIPIK
jgi:hypothetical protein